MITIKLKNDKIIQVREGMDPLPNVDSSLIAEISANAGSFGAWFIEENFDLLSYRGSIWLRMDVKVDHSWSSCSEEQSDIVKNWDAVCRKYKSLFNHL